MTLQRCRILMRRFGVVTLLVVIAGALNLAVAAAQDNDPDLDPELVNRGATLFGQNCAICHGGDGRGLVTEDPAGGPSLIGVGQASVDFMLRTGRMPIDDQHQPLRRGPAQYSDSDRRAIVAFVMSLAPGEGPTNPDVDGWEDANLSRGMHQFTTNCAACHGPTGAGIAVGQRDVSSSLAVTTPLEIAQAVRTGPGVMPRFGVDVMDDEDLRDVVAWVMHLRERDTPGGLSIGRSGPVSEGFIAWLLGLGLLGIVMYLLGEKAGDDQGTADA